MSQWPTDEDMKALREWREATQYLGYPTFPPGPTRDRLRRWGLIERWSPALKNTGRVKPWRLTSAGRAALAEASQ